jgi:hypothetical protein
VIHEEFGFFGAVNLGAIYYQKETKKVTFTDWGRNKLAFKHWPDDYVAGVLWPY